MDPWTLGKLWTTEHGTVQALDFTKLEPETPDPDQLQASSWDSGFRAGTTRDRGDRGLCYRNLRLRQIGLDLPHTRHHLPRQIGSCTSDFGVLSGGV